MVGILLAPYNDSMRLGQGYNSFLHTPCVHDAVKIEDDNIVTKPADQAGKVSQVVNYTSRFVDKISEVAKSMNVSAGSSIKNGGIIASGSTLTLDEAKFASSDLNAIVSVKVINQTTEILDSAIFEPMQGVYFNNEKFFNIYGNCYISGFIEGGDFTGILSARILDVANKGDVERAIKSQVNSTGGGETNFTLNEAAGTSAISSAMSKTESTITVSWSGGGQIKPENEEWTLETLYKAAAAFPAKVANCPQKTWAILTPYNHTKNFVAWAEKNDIKIPQFDVAQVFTSDLLDMYMEYKNCVTRIQAVLTNPLDYVLSPVPDAIGISVHELLRIRKHMKMQMKLISRDVDRIAMHPENVDQIESASSIEPPELWSNRLPILRNVANDGNWTPAQAAEELAKFSFAASEPPKGPPASAASSTAAPTLTPPSSLDSSIEASLASVKQSVAAAAAAVAPLPVEPSQPAPCSPEVEQNMTEQEKSVLLSSAGRNKYRNFRFDKTVGSPGGGFFCDAVELTNSLAPIAWPQRIEVHMVRWDTSQVVGWIKTAYEQMVLTRGNDRGHSLGSIVINFTAEEYVTKVRLAKGPMVWGAEGIAFIEITTNTGRLERLGDSSGRQVVESSATSEYTGLKGFYGTSGDIVDRLGPIWGEGAL
ncbi:unnamed protein product [Clonostachys rosea]|uniref:Jacalin-type lectin domain-containing protein n=1 Tax=Bionectria ochroleuca TaxID=29856 RepID=A0ABY6UNM2_BIOOC|nr:unnamed protein product [Clonostachys rosea]